jgi:hypothetical protein
MADVKALFPIGKTQWIKWRPEQRIAFNETRAAGVPFADAVKYVNELELVEVNIAPKPKKKNVFDIIEDVAEAAVRVAEVASVVSPVVSVAKTVVKAATKKKAK